MAKSRKFLLDTNILVEAHKRYYGFDLCPGFWKAVIRQHQDKRIFSIDRVKREIAVGKDKLTRWTRRSVLKKFFKNTDDSAIIEHFGKMVAWVQGESQYKPEAKAEFATVADGWLIACAKAEGLIVVTEEVYNPNTQKRVPIPNVCRQFQVEHINTFEMLRELGIRFVEPPQRFKLVGDAD
jgi:hypothetical protein